jgi:DNA replication protein DnaC
VPPSSQSARFDLESQRQIDAELLRAREELDRLYGNRRIKSGEVSNTAPEPLAAMSMQKNLFCQTSPVKEHHDRRANNCSTLLELFIPANMYTSTSRGMVSLNGEAASVGQQIMYIQLMRLFGYIARKALQPRTRMVAGPNEGDKPHRESMPSSSDVRVTWERVPHADQAKGICGYRLRITEYEASNVSHITDELLSLLQQNTAADDKAMMLSTGVARGNASQQARNRGGAAPRDPTELGGVSMVQYMRLCDMYSSREPGSRITTEIKTHIVDDQSPYNPASVFSPARSWQFAKSCGADRRFRKMDSYFRNNGQEWAFPDYSQVVYLSVDDINPSTLNHRFLPHIKPNLAPFHKEIRLWAKLNGQEKNPNAGELWASHFMQSSWTEKEYDIHALMHDINQQRDELRTKYKRPLKSKYRQRADKVHARAARQSSNMAAEVDQLEDEMARLDTNDSMSSGYYVALRNLQRTEWLTKFFEVISPTGACPPAGQALIKYINHFVEENDGYLTMHVPQTYENLSRFANMRAAEACLLNSIITVASCHQDALLYVWSAIHVFSRVPMNIHHLLLGPPGVGKSFAVLLLTRLLIAGTHMMLTYLTPKALAANGREMSWMTVLLEDAQASLFGVKSGKGNAAGAAAGTDVVNMFKQMLTSMDIVARSLEMDPKRAGVTIRAEASLIVFACLNEHTSAFEAAVLDRFCNTVSAAEARHDPNSATSASLSEQASRSQHMAIKDAEKELKIQWNRQQALCGIGLLMESCNLLCGIDTSAADRVFHMVYKRAMYKNIDMEQRRRDKLRFQMFVRVMVMANAVDMVFNSPKSPVAGHKYQREHWLHLEKFFVSTIEMGFFAIGMLSRQWQDNTSASLVQTIKTNLIPDHDQIIRAYNTLDPLDAPAEGESHGLNTASMQHRRPEHPFNDRTPTKAQMNTDEWRSYQVALNEYNGMEATDKFWMYATVHFGTQNMPAVPGITNRAPTQDELIEHVSNVVSGHLAKRFLPQEVQGKIRNMTTSTVKVSRRQYSNSRYDSEPVLVTEDRPIMILTPDCMHIAIPTLQHASQSNVLFDECQVVVSILSAMAAKRGEDISVYRNLIYGDTETAPTSRFVWRILKVDPDIERKLFSDPLGPTMESQLEMWNTSFVDDAMQLVTQDILSVTNPAYKDERYMQRLFDAVVPWTKMDVNFDEHAALCHADRLGLSSYDQHLPISNDCNVSNREHLNFYKAHGKQLKMYPDCFAVRDNAAYTRKWKQLENKKPHLFRASTTMASMKARQTKRPRISQDREFVESCPRNPKKSKLVLRGNGDSDDDDNNDDVHNDKRRDTEEKKDDSDRYNDADSEAHEEPEEGEDMEAEFQQEAEEYYQQARMQQMMMI